MGKPTRGSLVCFLAVSFGLAWGICLLIWLGGGLTGTRAYLLSFCMLAPALAALLVKGIFCLPWSVLALRPRLRGHLGWYLLAWFGPSLLTALGGALYFLLWPASFDPTGHGAALFPARLAGSLLLSAVVAPGANLLFCAGEELGWRGFLLTRLLEKGSPGRAMVVSGLIWGLWHGPMIAMGHNYGLGYPFWPWLGIGAMVVFCFFVGCSFAYLRLRTGSFWPAALAHGALNGMAAGAALFLAPGWMASPFVGPLPTGIIGGAGFVLAGLVCFLLAGTVPGEALDRQEEAPAR